MKSENSITKTENSIMNEVFRIIHGALRLDVHKVRNYASFLAEKLDKAGEESAAERLRKLLEETADQELRPTNISPMRALPIDPESRFPLLEKVNLRSLKEPPIILSDDQEGIVQEFLSIAKSHAQLEAGGVDSSLSLLVYGPPGCGKSRLARFIAKDLGLDLYIARLDGLISSYLGSTSKNIRALFDFASKNPCVLFLDEFDAIAKLRDDAQELGELKRVVNSFIQNLDTIGKHSLVIAATNHELLLDSAVWRRFSYRIELSYPSEKLRRSLWEQFLTSFTPSVKEQEILVDLSEGFSGSDIEEACLRLHRKKIVTRKLPMLRDAFLALQHLSIGEGEERRFIASLKGQEAESIANILRFRNRKLYGLEVLANILGVSKPTVARWLAKRKERDG